MRIVGGDLKGRVLQAPSGMDTRPTSEKVREAIFNILPDVTGLEVLDLFAGTGALGIEALSRGAEFATFVDKSRIVTQNLTANLKKLHVEDNAKVVTGDAVSFAQKGIGQRPWMLVFIDPPYASDLAVRAGKVLTNLTEDAIVVVEHDRVHVPPDQLGSLVRTDESRYGDTMVSFFRVAT
jgi:16S rRNA (guanine(966)-N(2))-methyltransferase RsmD